jgi:hypothetical protein
MSDNARLHDHEKLFAADEIGDVKHLKFKIQFGENDSAVQVSESNPLPVDIGNASINISGATLSLGSQTDAFGRLRTSDPFTLFDSSFRYGDNSIKWNSSITNNSGTAAVNHLSNESSMELKVGTNSGDSIIRETKRVFLYQPGKSLLVMNTFVMSQPKVNLRQRIGYFGSSDGIYFMTEGTNKYVVIRKSTSGSVDDTTEKILQANWNVDTLDGTGSANNPSGKLLDVTKPQILFTDIEWLGVGTVRIGFVINGEFIVVHKFHHANTNGFSSVYMKTATLPIRYEITNTGVTSEASTMKQICSTVISEGGFENRSLGRSVSNALSGKNVSASNYTPLVSIRLKSTHLDAVVVPSIFETFGLTNAAYKWAIIINPTLSGENFTSSVAESSVEHDIDATSLSGGAVVSEGVFVGTNKGGNTLLGLNEVNFSLQIGRSLAGISDIITLAARATTNNDKATGFLSWQEHN